MYTIINITKGNPDSTNFPVVGTTNDIIGILDIISDVIPSRTYLKILKKIFGNDIDYTDADIIDQLNDIFFNAIDNGLDDCDRLLIQTNIN